MRVIFIKENIVLVLPLSYGNHALVKICENSKFAIEKLVFHSVLFAAELDGNDFLKVYPDANSKFYLRYESNTTN